MKHGIAASLMLVVLTATGVYAIPTKGIGIYGQVGLTQSSLKVRSDSLKPPSGEMLDWSAGGGFVLDTNCNGQHWFNYRLKLGFDWLIAKKDAPYQGMRINFDNIFGFGIIRTQPVRIWIGPLAGIGYTMGKGSWRSYTGYENASMSYSYIAMGLATFQTIPGLLLNPRTGNLQDRVRSVNLVRLSGGAAAGVNFNFGDTVTLSVDGGAKYGYVLGSWRRTVRDGYNAGWNYTQYKPTINSFNDRLNGHGYEFFAGFSFMMRGYWTRDI